MDGLTTADKWNFKPVWSAKYLLNFLKKSFVSQGKSFKFQRFMDHVQNHKKGL